jgi:hypothetical protein
MRAFRSAGIDWARAFILRHLDRDECIDAAVRRGHGCCLPRHRYDACGATNQLALDAGGLPEKNRTTSANDRAISRFERSSAEIK